MGEQYKKVYFNYFGYKPGDFIPSELSGDPATDIHHIHRRGMGGTTIKPRIENLIALTRKEHQEFGDIKHYKAYLYIKHLNFLERHNMPFDRFWIAQQIEKYSFDCPVCHKKTCSNVEHLRTYSKLLTSNVR